MRKSKKHDKVITVTTVIDEAQHEALRNLAHEEGSPLPELVRTALDQFIRSKVKAGPTRNAKAR